MSGDIQDLIKTAVFCRRHAEATAITGTLESAVASRRV